MVYRSEGGIEGGISLVDESTACIGLEWTVRKTKPENSVALNYFDEDEKLEIETYSKNLSNKDGEYIQLPIRLGKSEESIATAKYCLKVSDNVFLEANVSRGDTVSKFIREKCQTAWQKYGRKKEKGIHFLGAGYFWNEAKICIDLRPSFIVIQESDITQHRHYEHYVGGNNVGLSNKEIEFGIQKTLTSLGLDYLPQVFFVNKELTINSPKQDHPNVALVVGCNYFSALMMHPEIYSYEHAVITSYISEDNHFHFKMNYTKGTTP